jgi:hypothetical protein
LRRHIIRTANASTTGLECAGFSRPHPYETLFQTATVPVTLKTRMAESAAIAIFVQWSRVYCALATEGGAVGHVSVEETHGVAYVDLPLISAQPEQGQGAFGHMV